jgi:hypothetical protein
MILLTINNRVTFTGHPTHKYAKQKNHSYGQH